MFSLSKNMQRTTHWSYWLQLYSPQTGFCVTVGQNAREFHAQVGFPSWWDPYSKTVVTPGFEVYQGLLEEFNLLVGTPAPWHLVSARRREDAQWTVTAKPPFYTSVDSILFLSVELNLRSLFFCHCKILEDRNWSCWTDEPEMALSLLYKVHWTFTEECLSAYANSLLKIPLSLPSQGGVGCSGGYRWGLWLFIYFH